jgi:VWFA-related protein
MIGSRHALSTAAVALLATMATRAQTPAATPPATPQFRSGVDVVVVEATVLDKAGAVVKGLEPGDFTVEVGGKPREIVSTALVEFEAPSKDAPPADVEITTNEPINAGRIVLLMVDQNSLRSENRGVLDAAQRWIQSLGAKDRVGLITFPQSGPRVDFTTDHVKVADVLAKVVGSPPPPIPGFRNIGQWEAVRIYEEDNFTYQQVVARECRGGDPICPPDIRDQSRQMVIDAQSQVYPVFAALRTLVRGLSAIPGSKHAVLISGGWMLSEREVVPEMNAIAAEAARTNVTVHTFTAEQSAHGAFRSRPSPTPFQDQQLVLSTVETLSGMTGGRAVRLVGSYDKAFAGLNAALSGYYRLGIRALPEDLDGKEHRISLKVRRQGASLASYRKVLVAPPPAAATAADPAKALGDAIKNGSTLTTLGLRATSYVLHGTASGTRDLRVIVAGDVSRAVAGKATVVAALYQTDGKPVVAAETAIDVTADAPAALSMSLDAPPGTYGLRLAVRDAEGRLGSLERLVEVRWRKAGKVETPGLVLFRTVGRGQPTPVFDGVDAGDQIAAQLALSGAARQARVEIDVTAVGGKTPLVHRVPRITETTSGQAVVHETLPASLLPPGRYAVRAKVGGDEVFTRTFTVRPGPVPTASPASPERTTTSATPASGVRPPSATLAFAKPRFTTASVLDPGFVTPHVDRLAARPDAASVRAALERVKGGPWPTDSAGGALAAAPVASQFMAGLGRLQAGDLEEAATAFRGALRVAPDFGPALIYLGACYAAGGKDREAAGAWQMALVRDKTSPVLQRLAIEAWLRADRPAAARALLTQARERWPDDPAFAALHAQAALADGQVKEALEVIVPLPQADAPTLLGALGALYDASRRQTPIWDKARDLETMRQLRERYAALQGDSLGLVDAWIGEMAKAQAP